MSKQFGYARVSTEEQNLDLQLSALRAVGCNEIHTDCGWSGACFLRPGLDGVLKSLQPGDILVVWRLDRLGRSTRKLIEFVEDLGMRGIQFRSLMENIDTTSSGGRLVFHIMAALAEFERSLISERTRSGMAVARRNGKHLGRRPALTTDQLRFAHESVASGETIKEVAQRLQIGPRTLSYHLRKNEHPMVVVKAHSGKRGVN